MPLRDIVKSKLIACTPEHTIRQAAELMKRHDIGCLLVTKDEKPVGIFTDRDIVVRCISDNLSTDAPVSDIMTKTVAAVTMDHGVQDVIRMMRNKEVRRIPVVDENGRAIALVSFGDIVGLLAKELGDISAATPLPAVA